MSNARLLADLVPDGLDSYEQGGWTPTFSAGWGGTYQFTAYTKVGRLVTVTAKLLIDTEDSSGILIGGLPFTVRPVTGYVSSVMAHYLQAQTYPQIHAYAAVNTNNFYLYGNNTTGEWTQINNAITTNNTEFYVNLTYFTD